MAIPNTIKPPFPDIPRLPGAPTVARGIGAIQNTVVSTLATVARVVNLFFPPQWGLFTTDGVPVFTGNVHIGAIPLPFIGKRVSVKGTEFRREKRISTAPQEEGAFMSYNKVSDPFQAKITYLQGGSDGERESFLTQLNNALNTLTLYLLVMPDFTYPNVNVIHYDYTRTARHGMTLLEVDVWVEQVRIVGTAQFTSTETPSGASSVNTGTVQGQTPPVGVPDKVGANSLPAGAIT